MADHLDTTKNGLMLDKFTSDELILIILVYLMIKNSKIN